MNQINLKSDSHETFKVVLAFIRDINNLPEKLLHYWMQFEDNWEGTFALSSKLLYPLIS